MSRARSAPRGVLARLARRLLARHARRLLARHARRLLARHARMLLARLARRLLARHARRLLARHARRLLARHAPRLFVAFLAPTTAELGSCGEELAARALRRQGWRLLGRRVQTPFGEVDIVAAHAGSLVCVEVKAGRLPTLPIRRGAEPGGAGGPGNLRFRPRDRLDHRRIARQRRAGHYLARHLSRGRLAGGRVDLVEVAFLARGRRVELAHYPNVTAPPVGPARMV